MTKQGFCAWDKRGESKRDKRQRDMSVLVEQEYYDNKRILGATKIAKILSTAEKPLNRKLVASIMKEKHFKSKVVKKYKVTTNSKHNLRVAENILQREFTAELPNRKWVSNITYIATDECWLYLAGILDLCGKEIAGWSMGERMTKENDFICSMSRKGNCWDNAPMESFWANLNRNGLTINTSEPGMKRELLCFGPLSCFIKESDRTHPTDTRLHLFTVSRL